MRDRDALPRQGRYPRSRSIEDESGPANVVVWPSLFEKRRRIVLGSSMMAINGRIQREGDVVHLVAQQLFDLSGDLSGLADRDADFKLPTGRGDEFATVRQAVRIRGASRWRCRRCGTSLCLYAEFGIKALIPSPTLCRAFDAGLPKISGSREWTRHSVGLGISAGSAHRHPEGEGEELPLAANSR
jgi:hypothetical protein